MQRGKWSGLQSVVVLEVAAEIVGGCFFAANCMVVERGF